MNEVKANDLILKAVNIWFDKWLVLTSGTADDFNSMTVGWGSIGGMWKKPFVQVVVRPGRYTFEYMEKYPTFTLCAFPEQYKKSLMVLGTKSGRDSDKITESGLTVVASEIVEAPAYREAELILECRKTYWQDMHPDNFVDERIDANYPGKDYHRIYYGEIVRISADERYTG
jgi:flavin reductase (DIM6/NTAB) family NADH-FMN oxidoreductase RutF